MIRKLNEADIDKVMDIWMKSTIKAHDFISKEYWQNNYNTVKEVYPCQKLLCIKMYKV